MWWILIYFYLNLFKDLNIFIYVKEMSNEVIETPIKRDWNNKEDKKAYMKEYMRDYMREYRKKNTEFYEKEKKYVAEYLRNKSQNNPEYREKKNKYSLEYYHMKRQQKQSISV